MDTLGTAGAFGLRLRPGVSQGPDLMTRIDFDSYWTNSVSALIEAWMPLTLAVNSLNRSMGLPDLYPFVLSSPVITKLGFVHGLIHSAQETGIQAKDEAPDADVHLAPA